MSLPIIMLCEPDNKRLPALCPIPILFIASVYNVAVVPAEYKD